MIFVSSLFAMTASADIEKNDVRVDAGDYTSEWLLWVSKGEEVEIEVTSDVPVNVYIMDTTAYYGIGSGPYSESDFSSNEYQKLQVTDTKFTWTQSDDDTYYLVIFNQFGC